MKNMKKYLMICVMAVVAFGMSGCYVNAPEGSAFHKVNVDFRVPTNAWAFDQENGWYSYYYPTNVITAGIYDYGTWTMSHEYNPNTKDAYLIQLPEFKFLDDVDGDGNVIYYSQRIDYEVGVGYVRVYVTNSDYAYETGWTPEEMCFHMQITY